MKRWIREVLDGKRQLPRPKAAPPPPPRRTRAEMRAETLRYAHAIVRMVQEHGGNKAEVGRRIGLSRERVRQLCLMAERPS